MKIDKIFGNYILDNPNPMETQLHNLTIEEMKENTRVFVERIIRADFTVGEIHALKQW